MDLTSKLLIAPPAVKGNFWYKTVIMIVEHHEQGSIGLVLNKKSHMTINHFGDQIGLDIDIPGFIYIGGPVSPNSLGLIHSNEWRCSNTLKLNDSFSLSSSKEIMPRFAKGDFPKYWRLFFGMCGWAGNQLHDEINGEYPYSHNTSWCIATADYDLVFKTDSKSQWNAALEKSAEDFAKNILI
jgi:putative transcriptional regulator